MEVVVNYSGIMDKNSKFIFLVPVTSNWLLVAYPLLHHRSHMPR